MLTGVTATFSSSSQLIQYNWVDVNGAAAIRRDSVPLLLPSLRVTASSAGDDGSALLLVRVAPNPMTGVFDYVVGIPTAAMPTSGIATYSLMGYTSPTATNGTTGYTVNGNLAVDFAAASPAPGRSQHDGRKQREFITINNTATPLAITGSTFSGAINTTSSTVLLF